MSAVLSALAESTGVGTKLKQSKNARNAYVPLFQMLRKNYHTLSPGKTVIVAQIQLINFSLRDVLRQRFDGEKWLMTGYDSGIGVRVAVR